MSTRTSQQWEATKSSWETNRDICQPIYLRFKLLKILNLVVQNFTYSLNMSLEHYQPAQKVCLSDKYIMQKYALSKVHFTKNKQASSDIHFLPCGPLVFPWNHHVPSVTSHTQPVCQTIDSNVREENVAYKRCKR